MAGAGTDFHVVGLQQGTALAAPVILEAEDELLEGEHRRCAGAGPAFTDIERIGCPAPDRAFEPARGQGDPAFYGRSIRLRRKTEGSRQTTPKTKSGHNPQAASQRA